MSYTPSPMHLRRQYFPYIDGLRALAVLSVLVYHLNNQWLPGGFVGVDVFFVISGFVVSASVANCQGRGIGGFLIHFYARRIKRIFPALIVCLLVTAFLSALFIPEIWLSGINQQTGLYAFVGLSNFILADTGRDYFAPTTEFNPYTHTWSLGVEEQFYLVFPFLFFCWLSSRRGQRASLGLFAVGLVMSALIAAWQSVYSPTHAYLLTPRRFGEWAAGVGWYQAMELGPSVSARLSARTRAGIGASTHRNRKDFILTLPVALAGLCTVQMDCGIRVSRNTSHSGVVGICIRDVVVLVGGNARPNHASRPDRATRYHRRCGSTRDWRRMVPREKPS